MRATPYEPRNRANATERLLDIVAANIAARRMSLDLSVRETARRGEFDPTLLSRIENRKQDPGLDMLCRLADVLGTTVQTLLTPGAFGRVKRAS